MNNISGKINFTRLSVISIVYALFYTFCLYRNYRGITFPFFVVGTACFFLYYLRESDRALKRSSVSYLVAIFLLGLNVCLTTERVVIIFDKVFIFVLFFMLFLHNLYDDSTWDVSKYFTSVFGYALSAIEYLPRPISDLTEYLRGRGEDAAMKDVGRDVSAATESDTADASHAQGHTSPALYVLLGLGISIPIVAVVLPLLMSSDAIFSDTLKRLFSFDWNINILTAALMVIIVFFVGYAMLCRFNITADFVNKPIEDKRIYSPVVAITVNVVLLAIYLLYSGIQIIYLFMRRGSLPDGYTYWKYAHEGFFQLVFVCLINIVLVLICRKYSKDSLALKVILCMISGCTYIMIASSAYRMYLYISEYKLTFLRLYVLWALVVMAVVMAGIIAYLFIPRMPFARFVLGALIVLWIIFAYIRPDYRIACFNIKYHNDDDYICRLSYDVVPAIEKYDASGELLEKYFESGSFVYNERHDAYGDEKERNVSFRAWNYSEWKAESIAAAHGIGL